jgi:hypothetical protein
MQRNTKIVLSLVISVVVILLLILALFLFYALAPTSYQKNDIPKPISLGNGEGANLSQIVINENYISYVLNDLGCYKLKSYLQDSPKILVLVDDEKFNSEVIKGNITTRKGEISNEDIKIITTKQEVINSILYGSNYMQESVSAGNTTLELKASYTKLFAKGYLLLYKELTGKEITGSAIKIFSSE